MRRRLRTSVWMTLAIATIFLVSCSASVSSPEKGQATNTTEFCDLLANVDSALGDFSSNRSAVFDDAASSQAMRLLATSQAAARGASIPELTQALTDLADAVQSLSTSSSGESTDDEAALRTASAHFLDARQRYQVLASEHCR